MFKIGGIYITRDFFDKLVEGYIHANAEQILGQKSSLQLPDGLRKKLEAIRDPYPESLAYLTALIRVQTEDMVRTDAELQNPGETYSKPYKEICIAASEQAEIQFAAMFPSADLVLINSVAEELGTSFPIEQAK